MTPYQEAVSLVGKYRELLTFIPNVRRRHLEAKACAIISVDLIIQEYKKLEKQFNGDFKQMDYWKEVKSELNKL